MAKMALQILRARSNDYQYKWRCKASSDAPVGSGSNHVEIAGAKPLSEASAQSLLAKVSGDGDEHREVAHSMIRMRPGMPHGLLFLTVNIV